MNHRRSRLPTRRKSHQQGYLIVIFVLVLAFVGVVSAMQVLILTSVATASRAFDAYRQGASEIKRVERAVAEAVLDQAQVSIAPSASPLSTALNARIAQMSRGGTAVVATVVPDAVPTINGFPDPVSAPSALTEVSPELRRLLTPELVLLAGQKVADGGELVFGFSRSQDIVGLARTYQVEVRARLFAVPLTRFPIAAYDLPAEIGTTADARPFGPPSTLPAGLVPSRDAAFIADLQSHAGVLPYHYRHRALLAAAYQYVFSQIYLDRVAEYAGVTHFCNLGAASGTAILEGMVRNGGDASWDLGVAEKGTYQTITLSRDAAVLFTESSGEILHLRDSASTPGAAAMLLLLVGPSETSMGPLTVDLGSIARPIVIVGYNIRITAAAGVAVNGALFLDPTSTLSTAAPIALGHLSYWAGSTTIPSNAVIPVAMPGAAELLAPRVAYVATAATQL